MLAFKAMQELLRYLRCLPGASRYGRGHMGPDVFPEGLASDQIGHPTASQVAY